MRPLWIVAAIACGVFAVAGVASASVREEARSLASTLAAVTAAASGDASPSPQAIPSPLSSQVDEITPTPGETSDPKDNHGADVSKAAREKDEVLSRELPNGKKTVTNHGMYVRDVARKNAGTSTEPGAAGKGKNGD